MSDEFSAVDPQVPVAFFPVRLEARFKERRLMVRIYPDSVHANAHAEQLTAFEQEAGRAYWTAIWPARGGDTGHRTLERERLAALTGPRRALYVASETKPGNWASQDAEPTFNDLTIAEAAPPVMAALLPDYWTYRLYDANMLEIQRGRCVNDVSKRLAMAPTLGAVDTAERLEPDDPSDNAVAAFLKSANLRWTVDFDAAIKAGMAFQTGLVDASATIGAVVVAGVRNGDTGAMAEAVDDQFRAHWFSGGIDILKPGTATNNTDLGRTETMPGALDIDGLFAQNAERRPLLAAGRGELVGASPPALLKMPATDTLSVALGMNFGNILDRAFNAERPDNLGAAAMNAIFGTALGQFYATTMLTEHGANAPLAGAWLATARHHIDWVRPGGPVPSLRIGDQPYGVLPVMRALTQEMAEPGDQALVAALLKLKAFFQQSLPVATLDPEATDGIPDRDANQSIKGLLEVLGAVPVARQLHLRAIHNFATDDAGQLTAALDLMETVITDAPGAHAANWQTEFAGFKARITGVAPAANTGVIAIRYDAPSLEDQKTEVQALQDWINAGNINPDQHPRLNRIIENEIDPLIELYEDTWDQMPQILREHFVKGGISLAPPAVTKPEGLMNFVASTYDETVVPVGTVVTADGTLRPLLDFLDLVSGRLATPGPVETRSSLIAGPAPLLHWVIDQAYRQVPLAGAAELALALQLLAARIRPVADQPANEPAVTETIAEIDWLTRDALGPFMNRLDAWVTSFAAKRLANMRADMPSGITIGGYGWLLDLKATVDPVSNGYIHAHSMNHAASAAVLRSGWEGYGTSDGTAPLSVDLTSHRMRGAIWILDAVRGGADLAEILGARFERMLHEDALPLDRFIDDVRAIVNADKGLPDAKAQICDGLAIARAFSADRTPEEQAVRDALTALTTPNAGGSPGALANRRVLRLFSDLADELDAVADVMMAQAVHALAQGKDAQGAATLNMLGEQEGAVPEVDLPFTPREAQGITHKIVALCPETSEATYADPISTAEPRLAAWLEARLPDPSDVICPVLLPGDGADPVEIGQVRLSELGLSTAELLALCGRGASQSDTLLGQLVRARALASLDDAVDPVAMTLGFDAELGRGINLDTYGLLAGAARDALSKARALTPEDLTAPGETPEAIVDAAELEVRVSVLTTLLDDLRAQLETAPDEARLTLATRLSAIGISGAIALAEAPDDKELAAFVAEALQARIEALSAEGDAAEALHAAIGGALSILPVISLESADAVQKAPGNRTLQAQARKDGPDWFAQVRKVATGADALGDFLDLSRALQLRRTEASGVVQLPLLEDNWAAVSRPTADRKDRLSLYIAAGFDALSADAMVAGFVADSWTEAIPRQDQQTGLALHFDSPSARPPQAILLSLLDVNGGQDKDDQVYAQLLGTLESAKLRAVSADRLKGLGHVGPATYVTGDAEIAEAAP